MKGLLAIDDCRLLELPVICAGGFQIVSVKNGKDLPFRIERSFFITDVPDGQTRGCHAHTSCWQLIIAPAGSFVVTVFDGNCRKTMMLERSDLGLILPPGIWYEASSFSSDAICLVLASSQYDEEEYIRDFVQFISEKRIDRNL